MESRIPASIVISVWCVATVAGVVRPCLMLGEGEDGPKALMWGGRVVQGIQLLATP